MRLVFATNNKHKLEEMRAILGGKVELLSLADIDYLGTGDPAELDFDINTLDGLHYSKADHAKLAKVVTEKIKEMLG
jgi:XTP/dITP diphosphohydrolase